MTKQLNDIFKEYAYQNILPKSIYSDESMNKFASDRSRLLILEEAEASMESLEAYRPKKEKLRNLVGKFIDYPDEIGSHSDFADLEDDEKKFHYIISVILDIKGSTKLATELSLDEVRFIKNGTIITAIDIFQAFDGHIHRLQGDAVFAFFGRKNVLKFQAIVDALNATTFLQVFFKNTLAPMFEKVGLPQIKIRVGIDFGDDNDVMWSKYGIKNTSEITTTSLHTDLAAKLQNRASSMGVMIGDNIVSYLDLPEEFISKKTYVDGGEKKRMIIYLKQIIILTKCGDLNGINIIINFLFFLIEILKVYTKHLKIFLLNAFTTMVKIIKSIYMSISQIAMSSPRR